LSGRQASHCFAKYATADEATSSSAALSGTTRM
jgi:hypothetical protein